MNSSRRTGPRFALFFSRVRKKPPLHARTLGVISRPTERPSRAAARAQPAGARITDGARDARGPRPGERSPGRGAPHVTRGCTGSGVLPAHGKIRRIDLCSFIHQGADPSRGDFSPSLVFPCTSPPLGGGQIWGTRAIFHGEPRDDGCRRRLARLPSRGTVGGARSPPDTERPREATPGPFKTPELLGRTLPKETLRGKCEHGLFTATRDARPVTRESERDAPRRRA